LFFSFGKYTVQFAKKQGRSDYNCGAEAVSVFLDFL
jgi:hypothetical protein